jgi:hypothetical protein
MWPEVLPFYSDEKNGAPKTAEARGTEAVLNALILTSNDARNGTLSDDARLALDNMWALELKSGERKGAWVWLNFHNEPWEADDSQFWGATLGALAAGYAPTAYRSGSGVRENLKLLREYLQKEQQVGAGGGLMDPKRRDSLGFTQRWLRHRPGFVRPRAGRSFAYGPAVEAGACVACQESKLSRRIVAGLFTK